MRTSVACSMICFGFFAASACTPTPSGAQKLDAVLIARAAGGGLSGRQDPVSGAFTLAANRPGLDVSVDGIRLPAGMGTKAWAAFTGDGGHAVLIGELPLFESEVNDALAAVLGAGFEVTALHNAYLFDEPRLMSLHFSGRGDQETLGRAAGALLTRFATAARPAKSASVAKAGVPKATLDPAKITSILWKGELIDGVYRVSTGKGTELAGAALGNSTGVGSWAAFAGSDDRAVVTGDIAALESELGRVLAALLKAKINVTSIHMHLTKESPRLIFVHYWGEGKAADLAWGLKAALMVEKSFQGST